MYTRRLTFKEKELVINKMNPEGANRKDCNFFRILSENENSITVEVGYWITYIGCKPKYEKDTVLIQK